MSYQQKVCLVPRTLWKDLLEGRPHLIVSGTLFCQPQPHRDAPHMGVHRNCVERSRAGEQDVNRLRPYAFEVHERFPDRTRASREEAPKLRVVQLQRQQCQPFDGPRLLIGEPRSPDSPGYPSHVHPRKLLRNYTYPSVELDVGPHRRPVR